MKYTGHIYSVILEKSWLHVTASDPEHVILIIVRQLILVVIAGSASQVRIPSRVLRLVVSSEKFLQAVSDAIPGWNRKFNNTFTRATECAKKRVIYKIQKCICSTLAKPHYLRFIQINHGSDFFNIQVCTGCSWICPGHRRWVLHRPSNLPTASIGGRIMCVGMPASGTTFAVDDPMLLIWRNLKVIGTFTGSLKATHNALGVAARGLLKPVCQKFGADRLPEAVGLLRRGELACRCVVDFNAYRQG